MSKIYTSASKIVFILMAVVACVAFILGKLEAKDFMLLTSMSFSFYFANKGETTPDRTDGSTPPYAGK